MTDHDPEPTPGTPAWDRWSERQTRNREIATTELARARAALDAGRANLTRQRLQQREATKNAGETSDAT